MLFLPCRIQRESRILRSSPCLFSFQFAKESLLHCLATTHGRISSASLCWAAHEHEEHNQSSPNTLDPFHHPGIQTDVDSYALLLRRCGNANNLSHGKRIHEEIAQSELHGNLFLQNLLLQMYNNCGALEDSYGWFAQISQRDVYTWNGLIRACGRHGQCREAFQLFEQMQVEGVMPDMFIFVSVLSACASQETLVQGKQMHARILGRNNKADIAVRTALINMYSKCGELGSARRIFDEMPDRDVFSWTTIISAYAQHDQGMNALRVFDQMLLEGVIPNKFTFVGIIDTCTSQAALVEGKQVHVRIVCSGFEENVITGNALICMYGQCGNLNEAQKMFDDVNEKDTISWTAMISSYARCGQGKKAFQLLFQMQLEGIMPDHVTFISILTALGSQISSTEGKHMHACIAASAFLSDPAVGNALVSMYGKCGNLKDAQTMFDNLCVWNVVSWTALIAIYAQHGKCKDAVNTFERMQQEGVIPNKLTFVSILDACAIQAALVKGKQIHARVIGSGFKTDTVLGTALINMYGKCGSLKGAQATFDQIPDRDAILWNAMIATYAQSGHDKDALKLLNRMKGDGVIPNKVTFVSLLSACSRVGLLAEGCASFVSMDQEHGIRPWKDHYNCIIDLLCRAGLLDEAEDFIHKMPFRPTVVAWMALLSACRKETDVDRGERIAKHIFKSHPKEAAPYVMLSNI